MANSSGDSSKCDGWCHTKVETTHFTYVWTIENFSFLQMDAGEDVRSAEFTVAMPDKETVWRLELYPNGEQAENKGLLNLFLRLVKTKVAKLFVKYSFYIMNVRKKRINLQKVNGNFSESHSLGYPCYIERCELVNRASEFLPNNQLIICCDLTIVRPNNISTESGQSSDVDLKVEENIFEELRSVFDSKLLADVTLIVGEREFRAHKVILAARSPVFAAMFQNDMKEKDGNVVPITDIDTEVFENVLHYIYSGKTPTFDNKQTVEDILYAANKYDLANLKIICAIALSKMLTVDIAAEILEVAEMHNLNTLKDRIKEYIVKNNAVFKTPAWKVIEENHPNVAFEIFHAYVTRTQK